MSASMPAVTIVGLEVVAAFSASPLVAPESATPHSQDEIAFKGVVFNEMKGVYSQPDSVNGTLTQQALFPDNTYAVDSGGNPAVIPDLTFEEFRVR